MSNPALDLDTNTIHWSRGDLAAIPLDGDIVADTVYHFQQDDTVLEIEVRYLANTRGNIKPIINHSHGSVLDTLQRHEEIGQYSIYTAGDRTYLAACLNPRGGSTVTTDGFRRNRYRHDVRPERVALWLTGQNTLHDRRCLVHRLSIATAEFESPELATVAIEGAWLGWASWWQSHYPAI